MKKDLFTFLVSNETPSDELSLIVKKDIQLSFRKKEIILKFIGFGLGMNPGHNISHYFMQFGMWACAAFCGSLFLSTGVIVAFLGMKGEELWWAWRRYKYQAVFLPAFLWAGLMLFSPSGENLSFNLWWIFAAMTSAGILLSLRSKAYTLFQVKHV